MTRMPPPPRWTRRRRRRSMVQRPGKRAPGRRARSRRPGSFLTAVAGIVSAMRAGGKADSGALAIPAPTARDAFAAQVVAILGGDESASCSLPSPYRLLHLTDPTAGALRVVAELDAAGAPAPSLYWGTYAAPAAPPAHGRLLAVEAPHPIFDTNTELQAADTCVQGLARYYLLAGAHRCADSLRERLLRHDGRLRSRGELPHLRRRPHRRAPLQRHPRRALRGEPRAPRSSSSTATASRAPTRSSATARAPASEPAVLAATLAGALSAEGVSDRPVRRRIPDRDLRSLRHRQRAGARDRGLRRAPCTTNAPSGYGRFVHVEQQLALRQSSPDGGAPGYQPLIEAVLTAFPAQ